MSKPPKIICGGQTGVDRAALDAALAAGIACGGWCPKGRLAEDGPLPAHYPLAQTPTHRYRQRTQWNVRDSDGTLVLYWGELDGGTLATVKLAEHYRRPLRMVNLLAPVRVAEVAQWITSNHIKTLNVAGPRESSRLGIYKMARDYLEQMLSPKDT
jgi:hypothetical protein